MVNPRSVSMPCVNHPDVVAGLATCSRCGREFCGDCVISLKGEAVCAGCKGAVVQDVKSGTMDGELLLAGRFKRLIANFIDVLVIGGPVVGILFVLGAYNFAQAGNRSPFSLSWASFVPALAFIVYEGLMLSQCGGQTLGKMALRIKVVRPNGDDISAGQAWGRGLARAAMSLTQILGLIDILMIFSAARTTLHDRFCKTRVVTWDR
jgi:uncharacterized RDD family membrane protein YckC